jgi:hypothetical protein
MIAALVLIILIARQRHPIDRHRRP